MTLFDEVARCSFLLLTTTLGLGLEHFDIVLHITYVSTCVSVGL